MKEYSSFGEKYIITPIKILIENRECLLKGNVY